MSPHITVNVADSLRLDDSDLVRLRTSSEDHFVERKTFNDSKDVRKTIVAFANSLPIGQPGYLFIGVKNNGEVEDGPCDLDSVQKKVARQLTAAYPRICYQAKAMIENGKEYLVLIMHGSALRPHFAGPAYIREGSQTLEASEEQYRMMIAERSAKVYEIRRWIGTTAVLHILSARGSHSVTVVDCNQFWVTYRHAAHPQDSHAPLDWIQLSWEGDKLKMYLLDAR